MQDGTALKHDLIKGVSRLRPVRRHLDGQTEGRFEQSVKTGDTAEPEGDFAGAPR